MYEKLSFHLLVVHVLMRITSRRQKLYFKFRRRSFIFVYNVFRDQIINGRQKKQGSAAHLPRAPIGLRFSGSAGISV